MMTTIVQLKGELVEESRYVALNLANTPVYVIGVLDKDGLDIVSACDDEDMLALQDLFFKQYSFDKVEVRTSVGNLPALTDFLTELIDNKKVKVKGTITKVIDDLTGKTNTVVCDGAKSVLKMLENYSDNDMVITLTKRYA